MKAMAEIEGLLGNTLLGFFSLEQEEHYGSVRMLVRITCVHAVCSQLLKYKKNFVYNSIAG